MTSVFMPNTIMNEVLTDENGNCIQSNLKSVSTLIKEAITVTAVSEANVIASIRATTHNFAQNLLCMTTTEKL